MAEKLFFEVLPTVRVDKGMQDLFRDVKISKVSLSKGRDRLRIYMISRHLIPKKFIYRMENEITGEVCHGTDVQAELIERYDLSRQYNAKSLMQAYRRRARLKAVFSAARISNIRKIMSFSCAWRRTRSVKRKKRG